MFTHQLDPSTNSSILMKLYRNVKNVPELRKQIMSGSLKCCIIKPNLIVHPFQVVIAANKAVVAKKMTTRTIYTELLFNLSISKNITQSLQNFGVDDKDNNILVAVIVRDDDKDGVDNLFACVDGENVDMSNLSELTNENEVKKAYKLSELEVQKFPLIDCIVSRIAVKDLM